MDYLDRTLTLSDGIKLKSRLWKPEGRGPWPALLMRQPYGRQIASTVTYAHPSWWASNGYLVIVQDVRGQGDSEGEFLGFQQEASDTTQTHAWVRSLPECNGLLGTYGFSYQGLTQLLGEQDSPPPECLAPAMTGLHEDIHWSCEGEAFWWQIGLSWGLQLAAQKLRRSKDWEGWYEVRESLENGKYLRDGPQILKKYDPCGLARKWLTASERLSSEWEVHIPLDSWIKQPMLLIGGWWDPHLRGILDIYQKSIQKGGKPYLCIGPASHLQWWDETNKIQLDFFNRYLKGDNLNKHTPYKKLWNITSEKWESREDIRNQSHFTSWSLTSSGLACASSKDGKLVNFPDGKGFLNIVHDPWRAIPSIGGHLSDSPGKAVRTELDQRGDVATFTSDQFELDNLIEGTPVLTVRASSDTEGFDLFIALSIIYLNHSEVNQLSTGVTRVRGKSSKIIQERVIKLQPFFALFQKGSKLRISISGSSWPAIAINPGRTDKPCAAPSPYSLITTISLDLINSNLRISPLFQR